MIYKLTKLSSGSHLYVETDCEDEVVEILERRLCGKCVQEAREDMEEASYLGKLLYTSCGAEFWLEETKGEEDE